ncbi:diaminobutyrate--2-oxoglutarate transaminase [Alicyclobacillus sp. SO9]|uniref:diaminobutyrate--2-oxoglutarate transaminase n=1 Tax=Alicyclobacillus sp. SO9 TaxID=2665646 RepID=UPI0018E7A731|nr:diaminobutyrate--2-oxoglutarate transaminase [Alicyclobacillus sp. SO9]QQE79311.1 diaminobutyrate--2-oxoglutarate transaminase [Alicyclobacillus sp. SO9]
MKSVLEVEKPASSLEVFEELESDVRSYVRSFPTVFEKSKGHTLYDSEGKSYIDFFAGAGALNYGHNNERLKRSLLQYIQEDGIVHSLDMGTKAKAEFLTAFHDVILKPRNLDYKVMFPGPTGTNAVESALKLARKATGRTGIVSFTNAFHGMTLGSLSITGNIFKREGAGVPLSNTVSVPYDTYLDDGIDTSEWLDKMLEHGGSGVHLPAAVIVETVQGEGGVNVASAAWLQKVEAICRKHDILLIVDDVQMGCGRTGSFFSFEDAGIKPDFVCLSKSISGYGLPMALTLIRPELDVFEPGEHNGTFRGHNPAFVTAKEALSYWEDDKLEQQTKRRSNMIRAELEKMVDGTAAMKGKVRGRGMIYGVECGVPGLADKIAAEAFKRGLIIETSGADSEVLKLLPPLTIDDEALKQGLDILADSIRHCAKAL